MDGVSVRRHVIGVGRVAEIVLDRSEALNALNTTMAVRLAQVCAELAADREVCSIVVTAAGPRAFCVGADLKERHRMSDPDWLAQRPVFRAAFGGLLDLPQPVVAAVHGYALGGGCELAMSCDLIVADDTAVFGLPETTVGLVPGGGGTQLALRRLGPGRAADLVLTGRQVPAAEAERIGLVDRLVPAGTADKTALEIAGGIACNSAVAVQAAKRALRQGWGIGLQAGLEVEDAAWRTAAMAADRKEGIAAFNEKRDPVWPGFPEWPE
jgi:enoyl-CoA hydratase/carnithine racemase